MLTLSGIDKKIPAESAVNMAPARAARIAVNALKRGRERCVPGLVNKSIVLFSRLAPRALALRSANRLYDPGKAAR
jgi:short-subunit dehydrogenase